MYKFGSIIITLFLTLSGLSQGITRLEIKSLPVHPSAENFYAAGSFNGWNPQDEQYKFKKDAAGNYFLELRLNSGQYEYKITRGGWDKVECRKGGAGIENRVMLIPTNTRLELTIEEWEDQLPAKSKVSTASKNVCIIDTAFLFPSCKEPEGFGFTCHLPIVMDQIKSTRSCTCMMGKTCLKTVLLFQENGVLMNISTLLK